MSCLILGDRTLSYQELDRQVGSMAARLQQMGVGAGDAVTLLLRNDFPFIVASLASAKLGAYATPINWHGSADEIAYVVKDSASNILIAHEDLYRQAAAMLPRDLAVVTVTTPPELRAAYGIAQTAANGGSPHLQWDDLVAGELDTASAPAPQLASMIYTSGTTGKPKGVRRKPPTAEQAEVQRQHTSRVWGLGDPEAVVLINGPMYHTAPNGYGLSAARLKRKLVLQPRFDAEEMLQLIERHRITHMHAVPTMFVRLLRLPDEVKRRYDLSSLRFVVHGAAPCPVEVKQAMIGWWGPVIHEYYGSTETAVVAWHTSQEALRKPGTVGRVCPGAIVRAYGERGEPLGAGEVGDLYVRSPGMTDFSYHGRDAERRDVEREDLICVGDIGWVDEEGFVFLCDRRKDMIISGGVNIYPAEIEAALASLRGVRDCAVFGIPDAEFGEAVCAWIETDASAGLNTQIVRAHLGERLAKFKIPKAVEFTDALPREDSGKIFKRRLRDPYWKDTGRRI